MRAALQTAWENGDHHATAITADFTSNKISAGGAAENYRLYQAGHIIRNISVRIEKTETPTQFDRAFVNIKDESKKDRGAYVSVEIAMQNKTLKNQVLYRICKGFQCDCRIGRKIFIS